MSSRKTKAKTAKKRPAQYALAHVLVNNQKRDCSGLDSDLFLFHFPISSGDSSLSLGLLPIFSMRLRPSNKRQVKNCTKNVGWKWLEAVQKRSASGHCSKVGRVWKWPAKGSPVTRLRCLENGKRFFVFRLWSLSIRRLEFFTRLVAPASNRSEKIEQNVRNVRNE